MNARPPRRPASNRRPEARHNRLMWPWALAGGFALVAVVVLFRVFTGATSSSTSSSTSSGPSSFAVGQPGSGLQAPMLNLPSSAGGSFNLSAQRGKTVLLYFQEGIGCQPCWDQMRDIKGRMSDFKALGIDEIISISSDDDLGQIRQKASDEGVSFPVLSDPGLTVSRAYSANQYGMMGTSKDGHSFIVVGPDGKIRWRADYGGAPNYTMYVKPDDLLAQMRSSFSGK